MRRFRGEKDLPRFKEKVNTKDFLVLLSTFLLQLWFTGSGSICHQILPQIHAVKADLI